MYEIIKSVILNGTYVLSEISMKIDTIWVQGDITDEQRTELIKLARDNADYTNEIDVLKKLEDLETRVKALENAGGSVDQNPNEYPEYVPGKWYYKDDKITYNKKHYKCIAPIGQVCTWNPDEYPAYWEEVV